MKKKDLKGIEAGIFRKKVFRCFTPSSDSFGEKIQKKTVASIQHFKQFDKHIV